MRFKNKVVIVTGGSRGIGRAIALGFGKEGASVVVNYVKATKESDFVVAQIKKFGSKAIAVKCDVSNEEQVKKMVELTIKTFGKLDILVNNAGIVFEIPFFDKTTAHWRRTIDVNLMGVFFCSKYAAIQMKKQKTGKIINISSTNGIDTLSPDSIDYDATKSAVISMTKNLAVELAPNIAVNCVAPGWVDTEINKNLPKNYIKEETKKISLNRFGKPEEIANAVLFLASDQASFITGSTLVVDGGYQ